MINTPHRVGQHSPLDLRVQARAPRAAGQLFFQERLAAFAAPSAAPSSSAPAPDSRQVIAAPAVERQQIGASTPANAASSKPLLTGDAAVLQALKDALTAAGIGFEGLGLAAHQDVVTYPGGSYVNRYISVNTNGHEEGLMTDLVGINPNIAVLDIKHMLGKA